MKNKLLLSGLALFSLTATAQQLHDGDILWPNSQKLYQYVQNWTPGQPVRIVSATDPNPSTGGVEFEDENFFISRVKLKPLFRNQNTQVNSSLTEANDKRLVNWVPINHADGVHTDALPNGLFDSEVFSNWSYVTHWGDWISPHGWVPAALSDAAHKHGVLVSGVASIPWGSIGGDWTQAVTGLAGFSSNTNNMEKLAKFLNYHGVNGLGYNSEFTGINSTYLRNLRTVHTYLLNWAKQRNTRLENIWYDGTNDNGACTFDQGLSSHNIETFKASGALFFNYNWTSKLASSVKYAQDRGLDPLDIYAGHNMQGGQPGYNNWNNIANYPVSIGLWGAHNTNMIWTLRSRRGSSPAAMQDTYQKVNEEWFTNAKRNPVNKMTPYARAKFSPDEKWFGMSVYMSARSSLSWNLATEPFISYFNVGNGTFLNWEGVRQNDNEWYNLGVQDYMPTWRWWFTTNFLGKNISDVPSTGLDAQFTWNDAWMGGSCLNIFGTTPKEYLHLFKTKFNIANGDVITVRYKLLGGKANAKLVFSLDGSETTPKEFELFNTTQEVDDEWVVFTHTVSRTDGLAGNNIAVIALGFADAKDLNLNIGEISIVRNSTPTPNAPVIKTAKVLRNNFYGIDAKIVFNMPNNIESTGEPCYNIDVNTSLFKLYAKVNGETKLMGITSSWAGLYFSIPNENATSLQLGVSAVSTDFKSESAITWSNNLTLPKREVSNEIVLSQNVIKPNEAFTIGYLDQAHAAANWKITNANTGAVVKQQNGATMVEFPQGLSTVAPYNVEVTESNGTRTFNWMIQITSEDAGAMPKIYDVTLNGGKSEVSIEPGEIVNVAYTGRNADGSSTRAISAEDKWVGGRLGDTGLDLASGKSFTVAAWLKYTYVASNGSSAFFSIEDRTVGWPQNNWGWFWSNLNEDGKISSFTFRSSYTNGSAELKYSFPDTKIPMDTWTHVAIVFEYSNNTTICAKLYINGIKQQSTWEYNGRTGTTDQACSYASFAREANQYFSFFGGRGEGYVPANGAIDELQLWNKALTDAEVKTSMSLNRNSLPSGLQCYWDFESDAQLGSDNTFTSIGANKTAKASNFGLVSADGEGQAVQTPQPVSFLAGNPFISGVGYTVKTVPSWSGRRAAVTNATGTGASGSARVTYSKEGEYTLTLTLANDYGKDTRDYPMVTVVDPTGVSDALAEGELRTYTVDDALYIVFAADGDYQVSAYNLNGVLVAQNAESAVAGQTMRVTLGTPAVYVVRVVKDGKEVKAFKVVRK